MFITLSPQRRDDTLSLQRAGDSLILNGETFDFSTVPEGGHLSKAQAGCPWLAEDVTRSGGTLFVTLILPHGASAPPETLFPAQLHVVADGPVQLPPASAPVPVEIEDLAEGF